MADTGPNIVIPYSAFLERLEFRRRVAAELSRQNAERTVDVEAVRVAAASPRAIEQKRSEVVPIGPNPSSE